MKLKYVDCDVVSEVLHHIHHLGLDCSRLCRLIVLGVTMAAGDQESDDECRHYEQHPAHMVFASE